MFFLNSFIYCILIKQSLRNWCEEYIRRINENFDRKLQWLIFFCLLFKAFLSFFFLLYSQLIWLFSWIPGQVLLPRSSIAFCFSIKFLREIVFLYSSLYINIPWSFIWLFYTCDRSKIEFLVRSLAINLERWSKWVC